MLSKGDVCWYVNAGINAGMLSQGDVCWYLNAGINAGIISLQVLIYHYDGFSNGTEHLMRSPLVSNTP